MTRHATSAETFTAHTIEEDCCCCWQLLLPRLLAAVRPIELPPVEDDARGEGNA